MGKLECGTNNHLILINLKPKVSNAGIGEKALPRPSFNSFARLESIRSLPGQILDLSVHH